MQKKYLMSGIFLYFAIYFFLGIESGQLPENIQYNHN